jgi:peptidoglycan/LPS O-acetylase OafA/YrhL
VREHGAPVERKRKMKYRPDVDGLRAVAVSSVVLFHALPVLAPGGFVGVDVFFVISGFLVTTIIQGELAAGHFSLLDFYDRRARRILPALLVVIAATAVAAWALYLPAHLIEIGSAAFWSVLFLANMYFLAEVDYFGAPEEAQPLLHLWSLGVEEQFYVVTPLLMLFAVRFGRRGILVLLVAASAVSFLGAAAAVHLHQKSAFYALPFRFWELGIGAVLAVARPRLGGRTAHGASLLGAGLLGAAVWGYSRGMIFPGPAALVPCLGAADRGGPAGGGQPGACA